jgi:anti-sigma factor RsiW
MEQLSVHDLVAAYALDALDPEETRTYEEHLATCPECRQELAGLSRAAGALAYAVDSPPPPAALRGRILDAARAERGNVVPLRPRWTVAAKVVAAAAACVAIGFGIWAASLSRSLEHERGARAQADRALAVLSDPNASRTALTGSASGSLVVSESGEAVLVVSRLDPAPPGKTYEAWVIENGKPFRAGTFAGGGDLSLLRLDRSVPNGARVAVTLEPTPGADQPSGPVVVTGSPV